MICLEKVTVSKSGVTIIKDFDLTIRTGENIIIKGANGSGKTTLLELISGKILPQKGSVSYEFISPSDSWDIQYQKRNQFVHFIGASALHDVLGFQQDLFYQQRYYSLSEDSVSTVREFIGSAFDNIKHLGLPSSFDISFLLDVPLTRLSNGQIKKTIILKKLLAEMPQLILFDYPFEGLDHDSRKDLVQFIDQLHEGLGVQFILTDHHHNLPRCINRTISMDGSDDNEVLHQSSTTIQSDRLIRGGDPVVEFRGLSIQYGQTTILNGFHWCVRKGERWALTGRNGSGKTTIFSLIFADHPFAYSQPVFLFGKRRGSGESIWEIKKRIAYLGPEQIHFMHHTDLYRETSEFLRSEGDDANVEKLVLFFRAESLMNKRLNRLSNGELQLIHLMKAFLSHKELILLDEPFQFLDTRLRKLVRLYMSDYLNGETTLIMITHDESDIQEWASLKINISGGREEISGDNS